LPTQTVGITGATADLVGSDNDINDDIDDKLANPNAALPHRHDRRKSL